MSSSDWLKKATPLKAEPGSLDESVALARFLNLPGQAKYTSGNHKPTVGEPSQACLCGCLTMRNATATGHLATTLSLYIEGKNTQSLIHIYNIFISFAPSSTPANAREAYIYIYALKPGTQPTRWSFTTLMPLNLD